MCRRKTICSTTLRFHLLSDFAKSFKSRAVIVKKDDDRLWCTSNKTFSRGKAELHLLHFVSFPRQHYCSMLVHSC